MVGPVLPVEEAGGVTGDAGAVEEGFHAGGTLLAVDEDETTCVGVVLA